LKNKFNKNENAIDEPHIKLSYCLLLSRVTDAVLSFVFDTRHRVLDQETMITGPPLVVETNY